MICRDCFCIDHSRVAEQNQADKLGFSEGIDRVAARSRSGACENAALKCKTRSTRGKSRNVQGIKTSEAAPCTPGGGLSDRGQDAPARNRFKGIRESPERAKGELESPPPSLAPPEVRSPSERDTIITNHL